MKISEIEGSWDRSRGRRRAGSLVRKLREAELEVRMDRDARKRASRVSLEGAVSLVSTDRERK